MITEDLLVPAALALVALVLAVCLVVSIVVLRRDRARGREQAATHAAEQVALRARVEELARQVQGPPARTERQEFVITGMGSTTDEPADPAVQTRIDGRLFADLVLRESVVKAASFTHGVRRALAPETRNRIRFEIKREVKRARKERRIEMRDVRRELAERQRAARREQRDTVTQRSEEGAA